MLSSDWEPESIDPVQLQALVLEPQHQHRDPLRHPLKNVILPIIPWYEGYLCALGGGFQIAAVVICIVTIDRAL